MIILFSLWPFLFLPGLVGCQACLVWRLLVSGGWLLDPRGLQGYSWLTGGQSQGLEDSEAVAYPLAGEARSWG